ncbi:MAG TPA: hypothetical protein VMU59_08330, partial [Caulobacteraceae bacterium]|nr:hypothetical protein [Caulobacteraceae bacterium]
SPCTNAEASNLAKPDGVVLLDPSLGGAWKVLDIDPAFDNGVRNRGELDLLAAANGYDPATGAAHYSAAFRERYFAAQSRLNNETIDRALTRLKALNQISPTADEPFVVPGVVNTADVAALHHADLSLLSQTKAPHMLLKADGTTPVEIIRSVRPASGPVGEAAIQKAVDQDLHPRGVTTVRGYLANDAVRTTKDLKMTADDVTGIDWSTSNDASPYQAEGIRVPALVLTNSCFQFVTPSEMVFDHLASKDKTYVGVEGSDHFLGPCQPQYGDTKKRMFDFIGGWLSKPQRF